MCQKNNKSLQRGRTLKDSESTLDAALITNWRLPLLDGEAIRSRIEDPVDPWRVDCPPESLDPVLRSLRATYVKYSIVILSS
jgi:hypothetical protein